MKYCPKCISVKSIDEFGKRKNRKGIPYAPWCKSCLVADAAARYVPHPTPPKHDYASGFKICTGCGRNLPLGEYYRRWNRPNTPYVSKCRDCALDLYRKDKYGVGSHIYADLLAEQSGSCAICFTTEDKLFIDHDHSLGKNVRGLLCSRCNFGIGYFRDDPEIVLAAARYLQNWRDFVGTGT